MVSYKLIYFNGRGRAEVIRQIFALAGEKFEDVRVSQEEFQKMKAEFPFGQLPVLEIDGKEVAQTPEHQDMPDKDKTRKLAQSFAIARFLAKQFGLSPKCPFEEALVDSLMDQYKDFHNEVLPLLKVLMGFAQGDVDQLTKDVLVPARDKFFGFMTNFLKKNGSGYLVGSSITIADLLLAEFSAEVAKKIPTLYDGYPEIKAHAEKVRSNPAIKKWIKTRPETKF
ncbi:unnamed protein product [Cylicocyclus nassatus]|uniref:glutathione transferase n=1 Tax=Cylicocyclus nassatus TaxID=53992 RepID=A0AA36GV32_CYLNA|nr:unnamed protein product [Cylicocyclus nassatus]